MLTLNELFSGIGAQTAALKRLGVEYRVIGISEIDKFAIKAYEAINGTTYNYGDINSVNALDYADLWSYSFPCQDVSVAGRMRGISAETRSGLLLQVRRLLETAKDNGTLPKFLLMENVKALTFERFKPDFEGWLNFLNNLGYRNYWQILNAADFNVPQNRERVFVVSIRKDIDRMFVFPPTVSLTRRLADVLEESVPEKYFVGERTMRYIAGKFSKQHNFRVAINRAENILQTPLRARGDKAVIQVANIMPTRTRTNPNQGRVYDAEGLSPTLNSMNGGNRQPLIVQCGRGFNKGGLHSVAPSVTSGGYERNNYVSNGSIRRLTPRECWRLMGFTDAEFDAARQAGISDSQLYKQAGNSIVVNVLSAIFRQLLNPEHLLGHTQKDGQIMLI